MQQSRATRWNFNPRTRVGCDAYRPPRPCTRHYFNPRTRVGCDGTEAVLFQAAVDYFNPRTRVGCDDEMQWGNRFCQYFNPRTRVGCDITSVLPPERVYHFNPRTRVGCDHDLSDSVVLLDISIHAPAWGATGVSGATAPGERFQSTHPRGVRQAGEKAKIEAKAFQSTHPRGVRQQKKACIMP